MSTKKHVKSSTERSKSYDDSMREMGMIKFSVWGYRVDGAAIKKYAERKRKQTEKNNG